MQLSVTKPLSSHLSRRRNESGQSLVEFALITLLLMTMLFALIDFGRAILAQQVLTSLSREAANLASRGTPFTETLDAIAVSSGTLDIDQNGYIILSQVSRDDTGKLSITQQMSRGQHPVPSRIGSMGSTPNLPNNQVPSNNQSIIVAEVFAGYNPITPVGQLMNRSLPSTLYDVAFF